MYTPSESGQLQQPSTTYDAVFSAYKSMQYYITWNVVIWFTFTIVLPLYVLYKHAYLPLNSPLRKVREPLAINSFIFIMLSCASSTYVLVTRVKYYFTG